MKIVYVIRKKFRSIFGKNFISVHDSSLIKYRVYNEMYARTRMVNKECVRKCVHIASGKSRENIVAVDL